MTSNEAAKWIQLYIDLAKIDPFTGEERYLNDNDKKTIEAMEMAISALTARPETHDKRTEMHACDCVSRQAAIDAVEHITSSMSVCVTTDECHGMKRMQRQVVKELANLPSAQPTCNNLATDTISRQAAIDELVKMLGYCFQADGELVDAVVTTVRELPSVQPEIIHCKDCIRYGSDDCFMKIQMLWELKPDDYCSYAERREEQE